MQENLMKTIDLRSDTVTQPCSSMRQAIFAAKVGDDVVGEDPSINELQQLAMEISGKEAALFLPSATMANQIAVKALTHTGDAIASLPNAHLYRYESGMSSLLSGVTMLPVGNSRGTILPSEIEDVIPADDAHFPPLKLVCMENTYSGHVIPIEQIQAISAICQQHNILMHLDGARIFNASVASGIPLKEYAQYFQTLTICLSKGLGAPVGALICSDKKYAKKIHRFRKAMGGGMRQAGIIAAAGTYALQNNIDRLVEDHKNARFLAEKLLEIPNLKVTNLPIETNMVFADFSACNIDGKSFLEHMKKKNILMYFDDRKKATRLVTHLDVNQEDLLFFCNAIKSYMT